ncbi:MAG: four helix bundle protein [Longimicrobiales bacterium]
MDERRELREGLPGGGGGVSGGWRLEVGGWGVSWRLEAGDWRLGAGGWGLGAGADGHGGGRSGGRSSLMSPSHHRRLDVWAAGVALCTRCYEVTSGFPASEAMGLTGQIRRCAVSVPANIAEASARYHRRDYVRILYIARGSLAELDTLIEIAVRLSLLSATIAASLKPDIDSVGRRLNGLISSLKRKEQEQKRALRP